MEENDLVHDSCCGCGVIHSTIKRQQLELGCLPGIGPEEERICFPSHFSPWGPRELKCFAAASTIDFGRAIPPLETGTGGGVLWVASLRPWLRMSSSLSCTWIIDKGNGAANNTQTANTINPHDIGGITKDGIPTTEKTDAKPSSNRCTRCLLMGSLEHITLVSTKSEDR